jgi:hypothetical protein
MASQGNVLHAEYSEPGGLSQLAGYGVRRAGVVGILTNAQVVAATSAEDLEAIVQAGPPATVHAEYEVEALMTDRSLKFGKALGDFSDTRVQAATSVEDLAEKTSAADESDLAHHGPRII